MDREYAKQRFAIAVFGTLLLWMVGIFNVLVNDDSKTVTSDNVVEIVPRPSPDKDETTDLYLLMMEEQVKDDVELTYLSEAPSISVLIKDSEFEGRKHDNVKLTSEGSFSVCFSYKGQNTEIFYAANDKVNLQDHDAWFAEGEVTINGYGNKIQLLSLKRDYGIPSFEGKIIVRKEGDDFYVVNELSLEDYLRYVVPSEMPSGYPKEALKAQAICARTYAYRFVQKPAYPELGAHLDDSVSYQVFNNIPPQKSTDEAIAETRGLLLTYEGILAETFFYSTSCGFGTDVSVWNSNTERYPYLQAMNHGETKYMGVMALSNDEALVIPSGEDMKKEEVFAKYISGTCKEDFEAHLPWYRWQYQVEKVDAEILEVKLREKYKTNPELVLTQNEQGDFVSKEIGNIKHIKEIWVSERRAGGAACGICIQTQDELYQVLTENAIRTILCDGVTKVVNNEGKKVSFKTMLPSAFFFFFTSKTGENVIGYKVIGGGYGHGIGMSQNGAGQMAKSGYSASQILQHFFEGTQVIGAY